MATLLDNAKGQISLSKGLLERLGIAPGQKFTIEKAPNHSLILTPIGSKSEKIGK